MFASLDVSPLIDDFFIEREIHRSGIHLRSRQLGGEGDGVGKKYACTQHVI